MDSRLELKSDRPDHCSRGRRADTDGRERVPVRSELCLAIVCIEEIGDVKLDLPVTSFIDAHRIALGLLLRHSARSRTIQEPRAQSVLQAFLDAATARSRTGRAQHDKGARSMTGGRAA